MEIPNRRVWARRLVAVWILAGALASLTGESAVLASGQPPPQAPRQQDEFVPVDQLPSQEQLPATPLVTIAYAAAWLVIFGYLWSIWRRLGRVERDLAEVGRRVQDSGRR